MVNVGKGVLKVAKLGLNRTELEAMLLDGVPDSFQREAIIKAILANNSAIENQIEEFLAGRLMNEMRARGSMF